MADSMKPQTWYHRWMKPHLLSKAKEFLEYSEETGVFRWKKSTNRRIVVGSEAGWKHDCGYKVITLGRDKLYAHRLAWAWIHGPFEESIDHINCIPDDNRIANLRTCNQSQNLMNYKMNSRNTSGVRGVTFDKSRNKWAVRLQAGDLRIQKRFDSFDKAEEFSKRTMSKLFGKFEYGRMVK